jgi:uncharacterized membrane protein YvbJ
VRCGLSCRVIFCSVCMQQALDHRRQCPTCGKEIDDDTDIRDLRDTRTRSVSSTTQYTASTKAMISLIILINILVLILESAKQLQMMTSACGQANTINSQLISNNVTMRW